MPSAGIKGINELNARVARDSMLPRFDLSAIGGAFGLGGNQIPVSGPLGTGPSTFIPGGLGDALHQMFAFQAPTYGFAIQMTLPLRSSAAEASLAEALVGKARDQYQQRQLTLHTLHYLKRGCCRRPRQKSGFKYGRRAGHVSRLKVRWPANIRFRPTPSVGHSTQTRVTQVDTKIIGSYT